MIEVLDTFLSVRRDVTWRYGPSRTYADRRADTMQDRQADTRACTLRMARA